MCLIFIEKNFFMYLSNDVVYIFEKIEKYVILVSFFVILKFMENDLVLMID